MTRVIFISLLSASLMMHLLMEKNYKHRTINIDAFFYFIFDDFVHHNIVGGSLGLKECANIS